MQQHTKFLKLLAHLLLDMLYAPSMFRLNPSVGDCPLRNTCKTVVVRTCAQKEYPDPVRNIIKGPYLLASPTL